MEYGQNIPSAYVSGNHEKFNCTTHHKKKNHCNPSYRMYVILDITRNLTPHFSKPAVQITHQIEEFLWC